MRPSRHRLTAAGILAGALALPNLTSAVGVALAPQLIAHAPLVLLMLHPYAPVAVLVLPDVPTAVFIVVAVLFRLGPRYLCFLAGRSGGSDELERYLNRHPGGRVARAMPVSRRLVSPALVVVASAPVSAMAGALGVGTRRFLLLSTVGATLPTLLLVAVGTAADEPVRWAAAATRDHAELWWCLLLVAVVGCAAWLAVRRRRPAEGQKPYDGPKESPMLTSGKTVRSRNRD